MLIKADILVTSILAGLIVVVASRFFFSSERTST